MRLLFSREEQLTCDCISSFLFSGHHPTTTAPAPASRTRALLPCAPQQRQLQGIVQVLCVRHGRLKMHSSKQPSHRGCLHSNILPIRAQAPSSWLSPQAIKACFPLSVITYLTWKQTFLRYTQIRAHWKDLQIPGLKQPFKFAGHPITLLPSDRGTWECISYLPHTIFTLVRIKHDPSFWFLLHKQRLRGPTVTALHISGLPLSQTKCGTEREDKPLFYVTASKKCKKIRTFKYYLKLCLPITVTHLSAAAS